LDFRLRILPQSSRPNLPRSHFTTSVLPCGQLVIPSVRLACSRSGSENRSGRWSSTIRSRLRPFCWSSFLPLAQCSPHRTRRMYSTSAVSEATYRLQLPRRSAARWPINRRVSSSHCWMRPTRSFIGHIVAEYEELRHPGPIKKNSTLTRTKDVLTLANVSTNRSTLHHVALEQGCVVFRQQ
jgi:hypothetical protein